MDRTLRRPIRSPRAPKNSPPKGGPGMRRRRWRRWPAGRDGVVAGEEEVGEDDGGEPVEREVVELDELADAAAGQHPFLHLGDTRVVRNGQVPGPASLSTVWSRRRTPTGP